MFSFKSIVEVMDEIEGLENIFLKHVIDVNVSEKK